MYPWICPKCQSVYGPMQMECYRCNAPVVSGDGTGTAVNPFIGVQTYEMGPVPFGDDVTDIPYVFDFIEGTRGPDPRKDIMILSFHDAPEMIKCLSPCGGDEDWVALVDEREFPMIPSMLTSGTPFGVCSVDEVELFGCDNLRIFIGSHA